MCMLYHSPSACVTRILTIQLGVRWVHGGVWAVRTCRQFTRPLKVRWIWCQKSPFLIDKATINCHFQQQTASSCYFTRGFCRLYSASVTSSSVMFGWENHVFFSPGMVQQQRNSLDVDEAGWGPGSLWPKWPLTGGIPHGNGAVFSCADSSTRRTSMVYCCNVQVVFCFKIWLMIDLQSPALFVAV